MEAPTHTIISKESITPSSKTPSPLKNLKLSYFDQLAPPLYTPLIFFYQADESKGLTIFNHVQISHQLKQSLSNALTSFYPLAGRVQDSFVLDCNDVGVEFIEARVTTRLVDVLEAPIMEQLKYLPVDTTKGSIVEGALVVVKITFFECGGMSIGLCISHQISDFVSTMGFINAWASTCRGESDYKFERFRFDLASYFPAREFPDSGSSFLSFFMSNEELVTKKMVFDKEKLAVLKQEVVSGSSLKDPTKVELVSAFIWKHFIDVTKRDNPETKKTFAAFHTVNMRTRTSPRQLLENVFGNGYMWPMATVQNEGTGIYELHDLVSELRRAISAVDGEYITKAQSGDSYLNDLFDAFGQLMKGELEWISFSSWCGFRLYEVDYGWGKPVSFCSTALPMKNTIGLVSTKCGDGIEVWVNMIRDKIEALEKQVDSLSASTQDNSF